MGAGATALSQKVDRATDAELQAALTAIAAADRVRLGFVHLANHGEGGLGGITRFNIIGRQGRFIGSF